MEHMLNVLMGCWWSYWVHPFFEFFEFSTLYIKTARKHIRRFCITVYSVYTWYRIFKNGFNRSKTKSIMVEIIHQYAKWSNATKSRGRSRTRTSGTRTETGTRAVPSYGALIERTSFKHKICFSPLSWSGILAFPILIRSNLGSQGYQWFVVSDSKSFNWKPLWIRLSERLLILKENSKLCQEQCEI